MGVTVDMVGGRASQLRTQPRVAAIVVTFNRAGILRSTLLGVMDQVLAPADVIVVDNGSGDETADMIRVEFPGAVYHRLPENLGFGGGLAAGITAARGGGYQYFWLLDDDSRPEPFALRRFVEVANGLPHLGVLGVTGGSFRRGRLRYDPQSPGTAEAWSQPAELAECDWVHLDGALVSGEAVDRLGVPRPDFFMMLEDVEYSNRIRRAGWTVARFRIDEGLLGRGNLGSGGDGRPSPPWRGYYQTRNHLVMAIEHRSLTEVVGWLYRQLKFVGAAALSLDRKQERILLRTLGAWHALRGVRGRSVEPTP